ncbi:MAG: hypothetical protein HC841_01605 [Verrucomicrobiae bacterium]|nr:hypothetical protein [Verrucomicrobiae bacterium]
MTNTAIRAKHWVLRHYLWIACAMMLAAFGAAFLPQFETWQTRLGVLAFPFAFLVTTQKQKTEELELFKKLFTEFNDRYDGMNEELNAIMNTPTDEQLSQNEQSQLFDYFNLCGEEYLLYRQGYIYPEVWNAWCNGMKIFYKNPRIKKLWDDELKSDSYYGFRGSGTFSN